MKINEWIEKVRGGDTLGALADKTGLNRGTLYRQLQAGRVPAKDVVAIAREYGVDPLEALVAAEILTEEEIASRPPASREQFLATFSDLDLLNELVARVDRDGELAHPLAVAPLDEAHPALAAVDDVDVPYEDDERAAALDPGYDPEAEQDPHTT